MCANRQSGPITTPLPITAQEPIRQPEPISAPVSITDNGPTSVEGSTRAPSATIAAGWIPGETGGMGWNNAATRAQPSYGSLVTIGTVAAGTRARISGCTITAPANVCSSVDAYRVLSRKLTSFGPAVCSGATPSRSKSSSGAIPLAAFATAARWCGPLRVKKRGSPVDVLTISLFLASGPALMLVSRA